MLDRPSLPEIWSSVRDELRAAVGESTYHLWLEPLTPCELQDDELTVAAPDRIRSWVADRYARVLQTCAAAVLGPETTVSIVREGAAATSARPLPGAAHETGLNPRYTFGQFVIGDANRMAHAAALAVAELPAQAYNPLFLYGPPGLGKTHLLHAIGNYIRDHGAGLSVRYSTVESFTNEFVGSLQSHTTERFKSRFRGADVLLVDDVQFLESKARTEEEFFHTFNALHAAGSQLVLTSDRPPRDLQALEDRLRERFEAGLVTDIRPPDLLTRLTVLRNRVAQDHITLPDESALEVIASRVTANHRALEGALIRVVAFHSLTGRPIDAELAEEVLAVLYPRPRTVLRTVHEIQQATCEAFGLSLDALVSASRAGKVSWPRQVAMYLARELTDETLPAIGREFGGRNHATVLHAYRRTHHRITSDPDAADAVQAITTRLLDSR
ncbi:MAG: chromosomal replication initiator protein [Solirubrobacteraceae bacterium]|nr:chromosomal replication initiator protein [Solirubrobacteraceae bacterium]